MRKQVWIRLSNKNHTCKKCGNQIGFPEEYVLEQVNTSPRAGGVWLNTSYHYECYGKIIEKRRQEREKREQRKKSG